MGIILCGIGYIPFAIIFALFTVSALVNDKKIDLLLVFIPVVIAIIAAIVYIMQSSISIFQSLRSRLCLLLYKRFVGELKICGQGNRTCSIWK